MKKNLAIFKWILILLIAVGFTACSGGGDKAPGGDETPAEPAETEPQTAPEEAEPEHADDEEHVEEAAGELAGDPVRGGLLYDKWWAVQAADNADEHDHDDHEATSGAPEGDHPLWATQDTNTRSGNDTWRCKECHGWDYQGADGAYGDGSHFTGFIGVLQLAGGDANDILAALQGETNADHDFSTVMEEQDLIDLALFISQETLDTSELINADKSSVGDAAAGETLFGEVCALCHGPGGNAINFHGIDDPEFLGHLAPGNPWEFVHKVRFGQPGWPMPSAINNDWSNEDVANVLAYAQTFNEDFALSGGGQLYDKWWAVVGADEPTEDHPLWSTQSSNERSGKDTWRCKECHGWDYMGVDGAYGSGSHMTGFPGVLGTSPDDLMAWLDGSNNADHDFSAVMEPFALEALVTFMSQEIADITPFISADGTV
ncbi:MAG: c-type cytochrome, partial [Anaerolineae bacterium]